MIRSELLDDYDIRLSDDAIDQHIRRYQTMLAARQQDKELLRRRYESPAPIILSIDGLQPEKGHETLYVVRELTQKRVWFAEPLLSATEGEVRGLIRTAKAWAESLARPVGLWMSDKQDAFVKGIAAEFPDVPHRYCDNHFLRDLAKPVLEADSHAKVQMRKKVRGLRTIEQAVLQQRARADGDITPVASEAAGTATVTKPSPVAVDAPGSVVLDYCAADCGMSSAGNQRLTRDRGVKHVALPHVGKAPPGRRSIEKERWFRRGYRFLAGIEGRIHALKRDFGLRRCRYRGEDGMGRWVGWGIVAHNLSKVAESG